MWAILSDIHGNLEALQAVMADAAAHGSQFTICLGDTVGYGPDPVECVRLSLDWPIVLQGNHEHAVVSGGDLDGWSDGGAKRSIFMSRRLLHQPTPNEQLWNFIATRPQSYKIADFLFVHGTPRQPTFEYLFPEDIYNQQKLQRISQSYSGCCFTGHTHVPGLFVEDASGSWQYLARMECPAGYQLDRRKTICNVGSVGQPRNGDWRASYVLLERDLITFRQVEYDIETTIQKIDANPELDNFLGDRLRDGR